MLAPNPWGRLTGATALLTTALLTMALLAMALPARAAPPVRIDDPLAALRTIYAELARPTAHEVAQSLFPPESRRLQRLAVRANPRAGEAGCIDFSYFMNAQDGPVSHVSLKPAGRQGAALRAIDVTFTNAGSAEINRFVWVREGRPANWVIDEVLGRQGRMGRWRLSALLKQCAAERQRR